MATGIRILLRLTVILRPAAAVILVAFYLSPLATHGVRTGAGRGPDAMKARARHREAVRRAGAAAHATPVYFQAALFGPLKGLGSDLCYTELTDAQTRVIECMTAK
jgi:hypothetical protein